MESTKLFDPVKVKKFFCILNRMSGSIPVDKTHYPWKDYQTVYSKSSNHVPSTREVFVHRTIHKWLQGKSLIVYRTSDLDITYKQYVSISQLHYANDWGSGHIDVGLIDYSMPFGLSLFGGEKITHNEAVCLEGEWCSSKDKHTRLLEMIMMNDVPEREYIFEAYDFSKYPKRQKKGIDPMDLIKTTISFVAQTEHQAFDKKKQYEQETKDKKGRLAISGLINVKPISKQ